MPLGNWGLGPGALLALEYSIPLIFHPMGYCFPYHNLGSGNLFSFRLVDKIRLPTVLEEIVCMRELLKLGRM